MSNIESVITTLKKTRLVNEISQKDVANRIGVGDVALSHWERLEKKPRTKNLNDWANSLGYKIVVPGDDWSKIASEYKRWERLEFYLNTAGRRLELVRI